MERLRYPSSQPIRDFMKEQLIEFMIFVCEGSKFHWISTDFHDLFQKYDVIQKYEASEQYITMKALKNEILKQAREGSSFREIQGWSRMMGMWRIRRVVGTGGSEPGRRSDI